MGVPLINCTSIMIGHELLTNFQNTSISVHEVHPSRPRQAIYEYIVHGSWQELFFLSCIDCNEEILYFDNTQKSTARFSYSNCE